MKSTPVFLPGKSHGQRSLAGYSPWSHKEPDSSAALGIFSCVMHTVSCSMWDLVPEQGSNQCSLNWEFGVLAIGPPGKSPQVANFKICLCPLIKYICCCCSVAQVCPTLQSHGQQHTRLPCSPPSIRACSNSSI